MNTDARSFVFPLGKKFDDNDNRLYARDKLVINVTDDILCAMESLGVSKIELAKRLSKSKSWVSQILNGSRNMTLGTLSDIAFALDIPCRFSLDVHESSVPSPKLIKIQEPRVWQSVSLESNVVPIKARIVGQSMQKKFPQVSDGYTAQEIGCAIG